MRLTAVVVLPSPAFVGVIAVTPISFAFGPSAEPVEHGEVDLGLVAAVELDLVVLEPDLLGELGDRPQCRLLGDLEAGGHLGGRHLPSQAYPREDGVMGDISVGVDVGGTFTDLVAVVDGELVTAKVPSVRGEEARGIAAALAAAGVEVEAVGVLAHGTTVATNALLERRGARTALVTTEGFRDVIEIGRQDRASLYDLTAQQPGAARPARAAFTVRERMGPEGVVVPLDDGSLREAVAAVAAAEVEAVAVCLLFAFLHPEHERAVGEALRVALPGVPFRSRPSCCPSSGSTSAARPPWRTRTWRPCCRRTWRRSSRGRSSCSPRAEWPMWPRRPPGRLRASFPGRRPGVVGAAFVAGAGGFEDVLTFDMGGTSTDVAAVLGGEAQVTAESVVAGVPIRFPMVDVHTIGAGGGSIAWLDDGGALRVGPRSAGARPGPACYGLGGEAADGHRREPRPRLPGRRGRPRRRGRRSTEPWPSEPWRDYLWTSRHTNVPTPVSETGCRTHELGRGRKAIEAAAGVVRVVEAEMARALRVVCVERGIDPRGLALVAFGGAGPLHACALAEELGMERVLVPFASGMLSALGLAVGRSPARLRRRPVRGDGGSGGARPSRRGGRCGSSTRATGASRTS